MRLTATNIALIVVLCLTTAVVSASVIFWAITASDRTEAESSKSGIEPIGPTVSLGEFTVNLANHSRPAFIRADVVLELSDRRCIDEIEARFPQVRDVVIGIMRSFSLTDLGDAEGYERMKVEIKESVNPLLNYGRVTGVFFNSLVIQQ